MASASTSLPLSSRIEQRLHRGELTGKQVHDFQDFLAEVDHQLMQHRIIRVNPYTGWFRAGLATDDQLRHFLRQFSVFSNQFLVASLQRVINASSVQHARATKEILLNELGVIYHKTDAKNRKTEPTRTAEEKDREGDPELVSTEGTVDGGTFRFRAAHFEWLCDVAAGLGMKFEDLGKRCHGRPATLAFCDELITLYGSEDPMVAEGASFAVENWAAAGFWQELEDGLSLIKKTRLPHLRLAFFTWHNRVEGQHAGHTMEELEEVYFSPEFHRGRFLRGGREILESLATFWDGLEADRLAGITSV